MVEFTSNLGIKLLTNIPYYAQPNRQVEVAGKNYNWPRYKTCGSKANELT